MLLWHPPTFVHEYLCRQSIPNNSWRKKEQKTTISVQIKTDAALTEKQESKQRERWKSVLFLLGANINSEDKKISPFTVRACTISGLKDAGTHLCTCKHYIFQSFNTSTFNAMHSDENPFTRQCEKENKKAYGFKFCTFFRRFYVTRQ